MKKRDDEIGYLKELLKDHPKGLTIGEVAGALSLNRASAARYLDTLLFSGQAEMRRFGQAKIYTPATRLPLSSFLNLFSTPMLIVDQDLFIREANDALLGIFSLTRGDVLGHSILHSKLSASYSGTFEKTIKSVMNGKAHTEEKSFERGGKRYSFIVRMVPVVDENGESCATIVLEDISELKKYQQHLETMVEQRTKELEEINCRLKTESEGHRRAKEAIQISRQKYRTVVEDMPAYVCNYEPDGTFAFANENACTFIGKDAGDLIGLNVFSFLSPKNETLIREALKKISHDNSAETLTLEFTGDDGTPIWQQWTIRAFFDRRGKITEYQSIGIDITDRIRTEAKLEEEERKLDAIIRGSPLPQLVIDRDHRIVSWNTAMEHFSGLPADSMIGTTTFGNIFYDRDRPLLADLIIEGKFNRIPEYFPQNCRRSSYLEDTWEGITFSRIHPGDGSWVFFTAAAIRNEDGVITQVVETMEDLVGYRTKDGTSFVLRSLFPMIDKEALE
ncbi:PAS domain S-box protein [Methanoregula sp. UBA64]|uniref:PAS domain S-box protein n=1 Tax=Methanoregula sp. UBA64 TaxID=1915554 RepID=UPI0025CB9E13|nr:PAS domain S-box protein [Methanoregula sp. UBA64]